LNSETGLVKLARPVENNRFTEEILYLIERPATALQIGLLAACFGRATPGEREIWAKTEAMQAVEGKVAALYQAANHEIGATIVCPPGLRPAAGQYLAARRLGDAAPLPTALFSSGWQDAPGQFTAAPPLPPHWNPGSLLHLRGPLGTGFRLPPTARRVALAALGGAPYRLLPLLPLALRQGADLALFSDFVPPDLPRSVEIVAADALPELLAWAGYLALDAPAAMLPSLRRMFGLPPERAWPQAAEILVERAMPCLGAAECGICAQRTRSGWALACSQGPVFKLSELIEEI